MCDSRMCEDLRSARSVLVWRGSETTREADSSTDKLAMRVSVLAKAGAFPRFSLSAVAGETSLLGATAEK